MCRKPVNTTWSNTLLLTQPLRDVRLLAGAPAQDWEELMRQREHTAFERGRREGEHALSAQLIQQRAEMAELQKGILTSLSKAVPQVVQESEQALIELALEVARKVVGDLPMTAEMVEAAIRDALAHTKETAEIVVQLHPEDLALLQKQESAMLAGTPDGVPLKFLASPEMSRGGCLLQTRFGIIDARREVKLEQLAQTLAT